MGTTKDRRDIAKRIPSKRHWLIDKESMNKISSRTTDFFDRYVTRLIIEKYGYNEMDAIRSFLMSETYKMFTDVELELYKVSPLIIFDMWESEQMTGDPRNSQYIREDEDE